MMQQEAAAPIQEDMTADANAGGHAVVIGAGIVGVSAAIYLLRERFCVTLIDRGPPGGGASFGNGGVLAPCSVVPVTVPGLVRKAPRMLFDRDQPLFLKWSYLPRLAPWLVRYLRHANDQDTRRIAAALAEITTGSLSEHQALARGTGAEKFIKPGDYLFLYPDKAALAADDYGWMLRRSFDFIGEEMDGQALRAYDPIYAPEIDCAVRLPDHGHISDPGAYVEMLARFVVGRGARLIKAEVTDIISENGVLTGVRTGGERIACDKVVLAAGVWSGRLARQLGIRVPLESERGYHLELWEPSAMPRAPVMVTAGKFVITPMEGRIRLAGIVEFGGTQAPPSRAPLALLLRHARRVMPGLTWASTSEWMGHRPAPADSIPAIGEIPGAKGVFTGFGHHHIGLTSGPRTGRLLAQLVAGRAVNLDLAPFSPERWRHRGQPL